MEGVATAEKLHVPAAPGCDCQDCVFIRNAYACRCPVCGCTWQAAFASPEAAHQAMLAHALSCRPWTPARVVKRRRRPRPRWYPVQCGWCGEAWLTRFTTKAAGERFLLAHIRGCFLSHCTETA